MLQRMGDIQTKGQRYWVREGCHLDLLTQNKPHGEHVKGILKEAFIRLRWGTNLIALGKCGV